jgi:hypothetical protein
MGCIKCKHFKNFLIIDSIGVLKMRYGCFGGQAMQKQATKKMI